MKAEYGIDTNNVPPQVANQWTQTAPANVLSVAAVRLAVVARSAQPVDVNASGVRATGNNCTTTTVYPPSTLASVADLAAVVGNLDLSGNVGLAAGDSWMCYRYKTFETTVPLRNVIWRP